MSKVIKGEIISLFCKKSFKDTTTNQYFQLFNNCHFRSPMPFDIIYEAAKKFPSSHKTRCLSVSSIVVNCVFYIFLQLFFLLIFSRWRLDIVFTIPVPGEGLDVATKIIKSFNNLFLVISVVNELSKILICKGASNCSSDDLGG